MEKENLDQANIAAYLVLIILASLTTLAAMVFGMLDKRMPSYTAAGCAGRVTTALIFQTIRTVRYLNRRK